MIVTDLKVLGLEHSEVHSGDSSINPGMKTADCANDADFTEADGKITDYFLLRHEPWAAKRLASFAGNLELTYGSGQSAVQASSLLLRADSNLPVNVEHPLEYL